MKKILFASSHAIFCLCLSLPRTAIASPPSDAPHAHDPRLVVELFAAAPDIVHPIGIDFDHKGRLLVIESHTHFPPKDYKGPKHDRIRILEDTDGDGKADRFTTFFEGTKKTMDIAVHPDGSVYLATRNEILRVRREGEAPAEPHVSERSQRLVFLDTKGDYPHNGLSGLTFDSKGDLYFGMGENIGADYRLIGSDGTTIVGGGEGGNIFWCTADGKKLRRVATGFWNPFGTCRDIFGRLFAVDNDPDAMPPCRMLHVIEGGDYGYQFRYGRSGRHVFQAWNGELPGTLPYVTGTGEAPCKILSYESDGLPAEYLGNLLVASWADHRIERYVLKERGSSFTAERQPFVQGGKDFRPVGIAVAPDGSLYVSDWVLSDYTLHYHGAIWHIRWKNPMPPTIHELRPDDPKQALSSFHRPIREAAARRLAADQSGRDFLRQQLTPAKREILNPLPLQAHTRRVASLTALIDAGYPPPDLADIADKDEWLTIIAVRALAARGRDAVKFLDPKYPPEVRREAIASLKEKTDAPRLLKSLTDQDPFVRATAAHQLAQIPELVAVIDRRTITDARQRTGLLLAFRASNQAEANRTIPEFLADPDEEVRFLAAKWVADQKLTQFRPLLVDALKNRNLTARMYFAYSTALARVDNQEVNEAKMAEYFFERLADEHSSPALRMKALQLIPPKNPKLTLDLLRKLIAQEDATLRLEAVRTLCEHPSSKRFDVLLAAAQNPQWSNDVRAQAILGLAERSSELRIELIGFALGNDAILRDEALRALINTPVTSAQRAQLEDLARRQPASAPLVARVLGQTFVKDRPQASDVKTWLDRLEGPADTAAGRRVFFHPKLGGCYRCHRVEGRGNEIGPDLSTIGRTERRSILESILQPSNLVAPNYQTWRIETTDGKIRTGLLVNTYLDEYTYLDEKGNQFKVITRDVVETRPLPTSIMPDGLGDLMTDQELRDLLAYLCSLR
jgi:putative membrane-bound dehydrogenase-like protein